MPSTAIVPIATVNLDQMRLERQEAITTLAAAIQLNKDALHRRLRGHVPWHMPELERLATHWRLPVKALLAQLEGATP